MKHLASVRAGEKRKSGDDGESEREASAIKKRRKDAGLEARDNVVFVPFEERLAPLPPKVDVDGEGRFALLPDWKERFPEREGEESPIGKRMQMPADMRKAAEAEDEEDEEEDGEDEVPVDGDEMEVDSDEDDEEDDDTAAGVDQDVIMQVLRQKLADSGLGDVDESVFKDAIAKMLSGEGDGEDALGGLTSLLLGQKDGGGKAFEGFLAGQGVDLNRTEEEEEGRGAAENNDEDDEDESHIPTSAPKAESATTPKKKNKSSSKPISAHTSTPKILTPTTRSKSKSKPTRSTTTTTPTTATTITTPNPKPVSPIVVPSPPPTSFKTSRKRRAPSLDEPALPLPEAAPSNSSAEPPAKRRQTPRAEAPPSEPEPAPAAGRRTTTSAAAAGKGGR
jgi:hypothetical protein